MKFIRYIPCLPALLLVGLSSGDAHADGGVIRLREAQGPFVVTIFTASEPLQNSPVDVSVMVQERDANDTVLDANVALMFTPPASLAGKPAEQICGPLGAVAFGPHSEQFTVPATRKQASNKLLYAAPIQFGAGGNWQLQALVERGNDAVKIACSIPVGPPARQLNGLLPCLALPPVIVALFVVNQCLRRQALEKQY
jgi:hypothetical protein